MLLHQRPFFTGIFVMIEGISGCAAPMLGGFLTGTLSWRWYNLLPDPVLLSRSQARQSVYSIAGKKNLGDRPSRDCRLHSVCYLSPCDAMGWTEIQVGQRSHHCLAMSDCRLAGNVCVAWISNGRQCSVVKASYEAEELAGGDVV